MLKKSTCVYCGKDFADAAKVIGLSVDELMALHFQFHFRDTLNDVIEYIEEHPKQTSYLRSTAAYRRLKLMMRKED